MIFLSKFRQKRISFKMTLLIWVMIIFTISFYVFLSIPYQQQSLLERMNFEAQDIASAFTEANKSALITDDYQLIVDYTNNTVKNSNSIRYIAVAKKDGTCLIFQKGKWSSDNREGIWLNPGKLTEGEIIHAEILDNAEVFHFAKKFIYTGIEWGWIHVGLSTESYNNAYSEMKLRAIYLSLATILLSFIVTFLFTRKLTKPISDMALIAKRIESGDLSARVNIRSGDELGMLAESFNNMTDAVGKSQETLENTVSERTKELAKANIKLKGEIDERKKTEVILNQYTAKLQTLEEIYKGIISSKSPVEIFKNSSQKINDNLIKFARSSAAIFDYSNLSALLYAFSFNDYKVDDMVERFPLNHFNSFTQLQKTDFFWVEDLIKKIDKSEMEKLVLNEGIKSYVCIGLKFQGQLIGEINFAFVEAKKFDQYTLDTLLEISNQIAVAIVQLSLEDKLKQHADDLQISLKEKEVLLKEIHHRVKNNLQIITSLLYLQSSKIEDESTRGIFKDSQNRVKSIALVHEKLYQSKDLANIDFSDYLKNLTNFIFSTYKLNISNLHIEYELDDVYLSVEVAVPLGLLMNELLSNALKYAFNHVQFIDSAEHKILISIKKLPDDMCVLSVSDNGIGLPDNFDIEASDSLGLKLVTNLVQQIDGKLEIHPRNNTEFRITFNRNVL